MYRTEGFQLFGYLDDSALADFMLIDRVRKFVKYGSDTTNPALLKDLERARAYEVSSLFAFMLHGTNKATLADFMKERGLVSSQDMIEINLRNCVWMEYDKPEHGGQIGVLLVPEGDEGGFVYATYRLTDKGLESAAKTADLEGWYQYMLKLIQFFESNPERMTVTSIVQEPRALQRSRTAKR